MITINKNIDLDASLDRLYRVGQDSPEIDLAVRHSPLIRLDDREPFLSLAAGYTIFKADGYSPCFKEMHEGTNRRLFNDC